MEQQHVSFGIHSSDQCHASLCSLHLAFPTFSPFHHLRSSSLSSVFAPLQCCLYLFPPHLIHLLDTKASWESITRALVREIKIWYSCLFYLQGFSSISLCVQPLQIAQGRNSTSPFGCLKLSHRKLQKRGLKNNVNILSEHCLSHLGWLKTSWMMRQQWVLQRCWRSTRNWCIYGELHSTVAQALWQSLH